MEIQGEWGPLVSKQSMIYFKIGGVNDWVIFNIKDINVIMTTLICQLQ